MTRDSFVPDDSFTIVGPEGQRGHRDLVEHTERFTPKLWSVTDGVWCFVGNGLSNQTFVEGPEGVVVIDTGESNEEMTSALCALREVTTAPIAAVIYTHFHYVAGTQAVLDEVGGDIDIWGHHGIVGNRRRVTSEVSAAASRGLVQQFGMLLDHDGPDGLINVGLGREFRRAEHAPFTPGFVAPTRTITDAMSVKVAGLTCEFTPAPSDADDSITIWFPEKGTCVHNIVWPALFNVFAIRGEEYRDPRILLSGLDHIAGLDAEHLVGAHGPPLSGAEQISAEVETYRDSVQFLWDQTVRGINRGLTADELTSFVQLPDDYGRSYLTRQFYGLAEHHVRQIYAGLRGWFDGDDAKLLPLDKAERCRRLIEGFGGAEVVRQRIADAIDQNDLRWAVELGSWLIHVEPDDTGRLDGGTAADRNLLACAWRAISQRTTSANLRNWALTRALELEGHVDMRRFRIHRFSHRDITSSPPDVFVSTLRVLVIPERAAGIDEHLRFVFDDGTHTGLHLRRSVAVPTDGADADLEMRLDLETWAALLTNRVSLADAIDHGSVHLTGNADRIRQVMHCFDLASMESA